MICHVYNAIDAGGAHMCSGLCTLNVGYVGRGGWGVGRSWRRHVVVLYTKCR